MEILPEHKSPLSSFLPTTLPATAPLAIPPIQYDPLLPLTQQTWQGTSYNLAWETQAQEALPSHSSQASIVLGVQGYQISQPTPHSSSTFSGTILTSPILPSSHNKPIPTEHGPHPLMLPSYTGISPYRSPSSLPPHQTPPETPHQSSSPDPLQGHRLGLPFHEGAKDYTESIAKDSASMTGTGDKQSESRQQRSERLMHDSPTSGSTVEEKQYTTPTTALGQRHSPLRNTSTVFKETVLPHPQSQPHKLPTPPQPTTLITISWALYLLATGKLARIPDILSRVPLIDLFNHLLEELVVD